MTMFALSDLLMEEIYLVNPYASKLNQLEMGISSFEWHFLLVSV